MLRLEEFGSLGCVKERHGGGYTEINVGEGGHGGHRAVFLLLARGAATILQSAFKTGTSR